MYIQHVFRRLDLYYAGPAPPLTAAGEELDDLDNDLSDLCDVSDIITYIRTLMWISHGDYIRGQSDTD